VVFVQHPPCGARKALSHMGLPGEGVVAESAVKGQE